MQHMQDKDFDQLFKDRFEDAEIQPSVALWNNIEKEIKVKQQRKLPVFWMAAASVVITVGVLVLFNKPEKIQLHGQAQTASTAVPAKTEAVNPAESIITDAETGLNKNTRSVEKASSISPAKSHAAAKEDKSLLAMQPLSEQSHLVDKEVEIRLPENRIPVTEELPAVQVAIAATTSQEANALAEEATAINTEAPEAEQTGHSRIRNAGDLVNFVVEKLDKREQKILEFRTDDDDNTLLVAINIGPFKLNTRKHK
jgi:cytoskeletal protein RodZ